MKFIEFEQDDNEHLAVSKRHYLEELTKRIKGPQLEGLDAEWLDDAMQDPRTKTIELDSGLVWPLFIPVEHDKDYRTGFFEEHFPDRPAYYFSAPPESTTMGDTFLQRVTELQQENAILTCDYMVGELAGSSIERSLQLFDSLDFVYDVTPVSSAYGQSYGLPKVTHFRASARPKEGWPKGDGNILSAFQRLTQTDEYESRPETGPTVLGPAMLAESPELLEDIWSMYEGQFSELTEDHPSLQIQPREELEKMILDDEAFNLAYFQDGKIVSLCYFVSNIDKCVWLNSAFFEKIRQEQPDIRLAYFPGIVVDNSRARQDGGYVGEMIKLLERVCEESGNGGLQIVFQCTNVSETYIPKIVTTEITKNGVVGFDKPADENGSSFEPIAEYNYRILSFGDA